MDAIVEIHSVVRTHPKQGSTLSNKKSLETIDTTRADYIENVFSNVKSQLHARIVNSVLDINRKNEKFRRTTNRCFEHIPVTALCMDSNISEYNHLFDELRKQLSSKFHCVIVTLQNVDQCSSVNNMLKATKIALNEFYPEIDRNNKNVYFQLSQFITDYNQLKESEKRSLIYIVPEFESISMSIFENFVTLLSLQIKSISISFILSFCGGDHSLQRLVSSRIASILSIDTMYDSSARKYYEYIIKTLFLSENSSPSSIIHITAEQLQFLDNGYFETFSLAWLEHALKFIVLSSSDNEQSVASSSSAKLNICLFNAVYVSCNQLPNYPLGRYRSSFYAFYLSNTQMHNELSLSIHSATNHQLDTCLKSFIEHKCNNNTVCIQFCQTARNILVDQQQQVSDEQESSLIDSKRPTLRSLGDRKICRYRDQVYLWLKSICDSFISSMSTTKINETMLRKRLTPETRAEFIRELTEMKHWKREHSPDLALIYRIFDESGTKIPLNDWFESFALRLEEQEMIDNNQDKSILARFVHGLAELDYLGFTKTSLQRSYHATKLTWDS